MFCSQCGRLLEAASAYCPGCGAMTQPAAGVESGRPIHSDRVGYSPRISDPRFERYRKRVRAYTAAWAFILPALPVAGFFLYGQFGSEMSNPEALYIGLVVGGIFLAFGLMSVLSRAKTGSDWDGVVAEQYVEHVRRRVSSADGNMTGKRWEQVTMYVTVFRKNTGGTHVLRGEEQAAWYDYYNVGDHVRCHGRLKYIEKYDKSQDKVIYCAACAYQNDIDEDVCPKCGCPLLNR